MTPGAGRRASSPIAGGFVLGAGAATAGRPRFDIGLVNIMPDGAFDATERQFAARLASAAEGADVRLHLYTLPGIPRRPPGLAHVAARYGDLAALEGSRLDALIVTGAEPLAERLEDEAYWPSLARVVDWAEHNTASTIWSCLAAHAAVLHLDGIPRRALPSKRSGLFDCIKASADPLLAGALSGMRVPHSRWNDLDEGALRRHGYRIVSRSLEAGIDTFTKRWTSQFVFLQGHPEYDPDTLYREFRRDTRRYLAGQRERLPELPRHYFDPTTEQTMSAFLERAARARSADTWAHFPRDWAIRPPFATAWHATADRFYRNWLAQVADAKR